MRWTTARRRRHRPDGPETTHALTFKVDHFMGAYQIDALRVLPSDGNFLGQ